MKKLISLFTILVAINGIVSAASFQGLGDLPGDRFFSEAKSISADGFLL